jgi:GTP-binding protein
LAIIGRPNAGKSSLVNGLLGQNRVIVSEVPGTTRDAIDVEFSKDGNNFTIIDTAGLRRRGRIEPGIEKFSSFRTINAIERCDVVCLVLDYSGGVRAQDLHISEYIIEAHKGLIILINKMDLMENREEDRDRIGRLLKRRFDYLSWAPVLFVSAKNRKNLDLIFETALQIEEERNKQIDPEQLQNFIRRRYRQHQPSMVGRTRLCFYDMEQISIKPPTFKFTVNKEENVHFSYKRYLENEFRQEFGFIGTAINFIYKTIDPKLARKTKPL